MKYDLTTRASYQIWAFYANVAEHGPKACSGPEKIYPCRADLTTGLEKPDGLILLDPTMT